MNQGMQKSNGQIKGIAGENSKGLKLQRPVIIAGPCSAESPRQLIDTASFLQEGGNVDYFRAGLWKPRTMPGSFEGVGSEGLKWLRNVKEETGMKVATEVGSEKHVFEALKYDIDLLWIGARTVSNPFIVQEIAESLRGVDIPVLVKNPLNPDLDLWVGAIKRFFKAGIKEVGAIHRGFSVWGKSIYRNSPIWEIPRELKKRMPGIMIICDPSHIAGKRSLVPLIAGRSIEEGLDGLMIEVHPAPENALSDAAQQLSPYAFFDLMNELNIKLPRESNGNKSVIDELHSEIDMVDDLLVNTIASRIELSRQIEKIADAEYEMTQKPIQKQKTFARLHGLAVENGLNPDFINRLFDQITKESLHITTSSQGEIDK